MDDILIKVHESYRWVVAVCDEDLFGCRLSEGKKVLDLSGQFFEGEKMGIDEARDEIIRCNGEDATFNIVGENSVKLAKDLGIVTEEGIQKIEGIPFALVLM